jgi:hypothetical protein
METFYTGCAFHEIQGKIIYDFIQCGVLGVYYFRKNVLEFDVIDFIYNK